MSFLYLLILNINLPLKAVFFLLEILKCESFHSGPATRYPKESWWEDLEAAKSSPESACYDKMAGVFMVFLGLAKSTNKWGNSIKRLVKSIACYQCWFHAYMGKNQHLVSSKISIDFVTQQTSTKYFLERCFKTLRNGAFHLWSKPNMESNIDQTSVCISTYRTESCLRSTYAKTCKTYHA